MVSFQLVSFGFLVYLLAFTTAGPTRKKKKVSHVDTLSYKSRTLEQCMAVPRECTFTVNQ